MIDTLVSIIQIGFSSVARTFAIHAIISNRYCCILLRMNATGKVRSGVIVSLKSYKVFAVDLKNVPPLEFTSEYTGNQFIRRYDGQTQIFIGASHKYIHSQTPIKQTLLNTNSTKPSP